MLLHDLLLSKRGPLAKVWLSAHQEKKLTKSQALGVDVSETVEAILRQTQTQTQTQTRAQVPHGASTQDADGQTQGRSGDVQDEDEGQDGMEGSEVGNGTVQLRLSGQLMLGVTRIYNRKVTYLQDDARDLSDRVTRSFRNGAAVVDLPPDQVQASRAAITLPDDYGALGELDLYDGAGWEDFGALVADFKDIAGFDFQAARRTHGYASSLRSASVARESDSGLDSRTQLATAVGRNIEDMHIDLDLDDDDSVSSIEMARHARPEREESVFSALRKARQGSVLTDLPRSEIGQLDLGLDDPMDDMPLDTIDLGLDDPSLDDLGIDLDRTRRETSRLTTPPPDGDAASTVVHLTPRTAARIQLLEANRRAAAERKEQRAPKRMRLMAIDEDIELSEREGTGARDVSGIITQPSYVPSDPNVIAFEKLKADPAAFFLPTVEKDNKMFYFAAFEPMAPELHSLFLIPAEPRRDAKRTRNDGGEVEDEDDIEMARRRAPSISDRLSPGLHGDKHPADDTLEIMDDFGAPDFGDMDAQSIDLSNRLPRAGSIGRSSRQGSVFAATEVAGIASGSDCAIAIFDGKLSTINGSIDGSLTSSQQMNAEGHDINEIDSEVQRKLGFSRHTIEAVNIYRQHLGPAEQPKPVYFDTLAKGASRRAAAGAFYETLMLATKNHLAVAQDTPYGRIKVDARPKLWEAAL